MAGVSLVVRGRPRLEIGTAGKINVVALVSSGYRAETRFRDWDGRIRSVTAHAPSKSTALAALKKKLLDRTTSAGALGVLTLDSPFEKLVELWLDDLRLRTDLSPGTKETYQRELETLVRPTFDSFTLREITTGRVDRFLKVQATTSHAKARHARTLLNLLMNFALRQDAIVRNPVTGATPLLKPRIRPVALSREDVDAIRTVARLRRTDSTAPGPKPDGQVQDLLEVMLGTAARIGEALALRKCDVDLSARPATVTICGTIVSRTGVSPYRQDRPKTTSSLRTIAIPDFAAAALRRRLELVEDQPGEHLLFFTRNHTSISPYNVRRSFRQILDLAGLGDRGITMHSLRRVAATIIARKAGYDTAAQFLGHTSAAITKAYYVDNDPESVDPLPARLVQDVLGPTAEDSRTSSYSA